MWAPHLESETVFIVCEKTAREKLKMRCKNWKNVRTCAYMCRYTCAVHRWVQVLSAGGLKEKKHQPWWHRPIISQQTMMIRSRKTRQGIKCVWWIKSGGDTSFEISARKTWRLRDSTLFENIGSCRCNHAEAKGEDAQRPSHFHKFEVCEFINVARYFFPLASQRLVAGWRVQEVTPGRNVD